MKKISSDKLGRLIIDKREELGLTQEELGEKTEINRQIIGRIENRKHIPSISQLNSIMSVLNFDLNDITEEQEEKSVFVAMMGNAETSNEKEWLEEMVSMMLCLRKHTRIRTSINDANTTIG
ncbi:helix-turn-helix transcriptional regulator [Filibacter tadaridae]|uniref:DNA-binding transcriptional repressor PuuR n=1 Tax=Filibacter tadaridae TaxID=2483811 RepID=A0A3P5WP11_9BACL|nr:helix-turn-helix transcriptional regulator [Filibacter tadaridae]VDC25183.1 DNA-binding transcriptional repressor PuuR [Filibacter tadaridae]